MAKARAYLESSSVERPPAFQEYAAPALAAESVRLMSLPERGLFWTMRLYCWLNDSIPNEAVAMARALGLQEGEVRECLTSPVRAFFEPAEDDPTRLVCPALVRQMSRLMENREARAKAGRDSAKKRRENRIPVIGDRHGDRDGDRHGQEKSKAELKSTQLGRERNERSVDPFVQEIDAADARERRRA